MFEIAIRIKELASSNINNLVDHASSPVKMLKLLQLELEEAIIALTRDATRAERRARDCGVQGAAQDKAAADWQVKAKLALSNAREDLARGALLEKDKAAKAAADLRLSAQDAEAEQAALAAAIVDLETKLAETRERLRAELAKSEAAAEAARPSSAGTSRVNTRVDTMSDRITVLEQRINFAAAGEGPKASSLDAELAALKREAMLDDELAALKKSMKKEK